MFCRQESMRGAPDDVILARAQAEKRLLITQDKDFGELAFRSNLPASYGIVLLRLSGTSPHSDNQRALEALESRVDWAEHFSVVTDDRIRMRPLLTNPWQESPSGESERSDRRMARSGRSPSTGRVHRDTASANFSTSLHRPGCVCSTCRPSLRTASRFASSGK